MARRDNSISRKGFYMFLSFQEHEGLSPRPEAGGFILLVLRGIKVNDTLAGFLGLQGSSLSHTACYRIELGIVDEVFEVRTRSEQYVHRLDVLRSELVDALRPLTADADDERAKLAQLNLVAVEKLFHQTLAHVTNDTLHRTAAIHPVVVGDVLRELLQRPYLRYLVPCISLFRLLRISWITLHKHTIVDHSFAHRRYGT